MGNSYVVMPTQIRTTKERREERQALDRARVNWHRIDVADAARKRGGSILDCARRATTPKAAADVRAMLAAAPGASQATRRKVEKLLTEVGL